jgi:hypothetical protein
LSLFQGRVCAATTLYNLGWIKSEIYDAWVRGDKDIDVIQFSSVQNPAFPKQEFERARSKMQDWRFDMFYRGQFAKPAGLIYSSWKIYACGCFRHTSRVGAYTWRTGGPILR